MDPLGLEPLGAGRGGPLGSIPGPVPAPGTIAIRGTLSVAILAAVPVPALAAGVLAAVSAFATVVLAVIAVSALAAVIPALAAISAIATVIPAVIAVSAFALSGSAILTRVAPIPPRPSVLTGTPLAFGTVVVLAARSLRLKAAALFRGELGRHQGADFTTQQLEALRLGTLRFGREDRDDVEAVEVDISLNPENVTHRSRLRNQRTGHLALGATGAGSPPSPRPVIATAG